MITRYLFASVALYLSWGLVSAFREIDQNSRMTQDLLLEAGRDCLPCGELFSRTTTNAEGKKIQEVQIEERGEPKCGTTMMFSWAISTLVRTCDYLRATYGNGSCFVDPEPDIGSMPSQTTLTFEPGAGSHDRDACPCDDLDMVRISITDEGKHKLPVDKSCPWRHPNSLSMDVFRCTTVGGRPVENYADIWACMQESPCELSDDNLQFAPLRDPRAVAVSTYFHRLRHSPRPTGVDEAAIASLPSVSQWIALRHILFEGLMANSSMTFWFEDALEDPLNWHIRWTELAGLQLPISWIEYITSLRFVNPWSTDQRLGINIHPGGGEASEARDWTDEVSPDIIDEMNSIVRTWLPGVLLARLGIPS